MEPKGIYGDGSNTSKTVISQNTALMDQIANEINDFADTFGVETEDFFSDLENRIGTTRTDNTAWWGPQAQFFLDEFKKKKDTSFAPAKANIIAYSENMATQSKNWQTFEKI